MVKYVVQNKSDWQVTVPHCSVTETPVSGSYNKTFFFYKQILKNLFLKNIVFLKSFSGVSDYTPEANVCVEALLERKNHAETCSRVVHVKTYLLVSEKFVCACVRAAIQCTERTPVKTQ